MSHLHRAYFNELAPQWDTLHPTGDELISLLQRFGIANYDHVLDLGAGTGRLVSTVLAIAPHCTVVELDFSENMLRQGKQSLSETGIDFLCSDACHLGVKSNCFHKVICYSSFPHFKNVRTALQEIGRVLMPNGKVLILHTCCSIRLNDFHASLNGIVCNDKLIKADALSHLMRASGLEPTQVIEHPDLYWVEAKKT